MLLPLVIVVVLADLADGGLDAKGIALIGVLSAIAAALRPFGGGHAGFEPMWIVIILGGRVLGPGAGFGIGAIGMFASMPVAILAHPTFEPKTVGDFIALAKKEGGKMNIGTSAVGTGGYLSAELFKSMTGIEAVLVPYKGTAPLMNDLLGGHVKVAFGVLPPAMGNLAAGTLRGMAVLDRQRFSLLPDVPTAHESGLPGFESVLHYGLLGPAGLPRPIVDKLNAALKAAATTDEVKKRINNEGGDPMTSTPEEYARDIDQEETKWGTLIRKLNLKVE